MLDNITPSTQKVGLSRRIGIMFYDAVLLIAVLFFASLLFVLPSQITYGHPLYFLYVIYIYIVAFIFYGWFWTHGGQTLGLSTWHVQLISDQDDSVTWKQAFVRYTVSLLSWLALGIGYLWVYTNKERLAWNDIASKTRLRRISKISD